MHVLGVQRRGLGVQMRVLGVQRRGLGVHMRALGVQKSWQGVQGCCVTSAWTTPKSGMRPLHLQCLQGCAQGSSGCTELSRNSTHLAGRCLLSGESLVCTPSAHLYCSGCCELAAFQSPVGNLLSSGKG